MKKDEKRDFDKEAAEWDKNPGRVRLAQDVGASMIREVKPDRSMDVLDFGCGTGLVTLQFQPLVKSITGADSSAGMLAVLEEKIRSQGLKNAGTRQVDFEKGERIVGSYHLIISSMTLHHVPDTLTLFNQWAELLHPGGRICFTDLDSEDGSFHGDNTGVFHLGFDRAAMKHLLQDAGFGDIRDSAAATMMRDVPDGRKEFSVFLMSATKK
jgi:ubiquinone/menaquinone biosynthesis C-methylase UbiE